MRFMNISDANDILKQILSVIFTNFRTCCLLLCLADSTVCLADTQHVRSSAHRQHCASRRHTTCPLAFMNATPRGVMFMNAASFTLTSVRTAKPFDSDDVPFSNIYFLVRCGKGRFCRGSDRVWLCSGKLTVVWAKWSVKGEVFR